jgi:hypothetical protein
MTNSDERIAMIRFGKFPAGVGKFPAQWQKIPCGQRKNSLLGRGKSVQSHLVSMGHRGRERKIPCSQGI